MDINTSVATIKSTINENRQIYSTYETLKFNITKHNLKSNLLLQSSLSNKNLLLKWCELENLPHYIINAMQVLK